MAKQVRVSMDVVMEVPEDWKVIDERVFETPDGKAVGLVVALEHDFEGPGAKMLVDDLQMRKVGAQVIEYVQTNIEED